MGWINILSGKNRRYKIGSRETYCQVKITGRFTPVSTALIPVQNMGWINILSGKITGKKYGLDEHSIRQISQLGLHVRMGPCVRYLGIDTKLAADRGETSVPASR